MKVLVTGASGNAGTAVCHLLVEKGFDLRRCDVAPPVSDDLPQVELVRCDTRTVSDVQRAMNGCHAVVHLAAWHCAHNPPVSDATIFAVNVDGTFNVFEAAREAGVGAVVFASSMAFGWGGVYGVTKVIGEDLCRMYHETTGASVAMLRYHDFVPKPYLAFGAKLLRNGVDRRDVASATVASLEAAVERKFGLFGSIIHTDHGMPRGVVDNFGELGVEWGEAQVPGARELIAKYEIELPNSVEQHDLSEANRLLGWKPRIGFTEFLLDLKARDANLEDIRTLWAPGQLPA
ncbi:NAD-dependent epimerase/dehydratase family protein [Fimbriimonas ginsengisoli]|uniref:NAD-dependent epimerase/dehydratase n=1 Tax=Fimbriimonas ginsengisoli Gsoil 348 TaxID=661478 RepID=A0A068NMQ5_FIMGI|nr:NAD(P)-dependent oxidoreductase [Fimbriimonas ginsengisoli]AIE84848.1 NAD-dependent epimerase/dehydratase [Fimbriimonas ginsengisoli Gsoil 348]